MGKILPFRRRPDADVLLAEWRAVADRAAYVAHLVDDLHDDADAMQLRAELYAEYAAARSAYREAANG